jgi:hypothetical protein
MFFFSLIGFLISGIFLGRAYFDYFFSIVACLAALERLARKDLATAVAESEESESDLIADGVLVPQREAAL